MKKALSKDYLTNVTLSYCLPRANEFLKFYYYTVVDTMCMRGK